MKQNNGKLLLKIKKRRESVPSPNNITKQLSENKENLNQRGQKRVNPFARTEEESKKFHKYENGTEKKSFAESVFLQGLKSCDGNKIELKKPLKYIPLTDDNASKIREDPDSSKVTFQYGKKEFLLDWSIKQRLRFISSKPFLSCKNIKSVDESKGINHFTRCKGNEMQFCQYLSNWIFPFIPGLTNFPYKKRSAMVIIKDEKSCNVIGSNKLSQEILLQHWKTSFQSLFNMLKTGYCPYFYMCGYQFSVLFKSANVGEESMSVIVTPTTKGLRSMLADEGISFEFPHKDGFSGSDDEIEAEEEAEEEMLNNSNNDTDEFLDSIGLNQQQHFPNIQEQQRLLVKAKMRYLDNRPESTIKIRNSQGFFNFILNSSILCAPSGRMIGIPPTLISPSPFEGGTLSKAKFTHGPVRHQKGSCIQTVYCVDVNGVVLPTQFHGLVQLLSDSKNDDLIIQAKTFEKLLPLNAGGGKCIINEIQREEFGLTRQECSFLNQEYQVISDTSEVTFADHLFKY